MTPPPVTPPPVTPPPVPPPPVPPPPAGVPAAVVPRGEVPEKVLRAVIQALATHGFVGTTARSIAAIGGFAPGVIYYYFRDLDEVLIATTEYTGRQRMERYRAAVLGVTSAVTLVERLRVLYAEDGESGHIEAVQELVSAARPGTPLAAAVAAQTGQWEELGEQVLRDLLRGTPLARLVKVPVVARAAVAYYLGLQTLTHLDGDAERPRAAFDQAAKLAAAFDRLPRLARKSRRRAPLPTVPPDTGSPEADSA